MSTPTELFLPPDFPYPIKIVSIDSAATSSVERGTRLLSYTFTYVSPDRTVRPEPRYGTWDSTVEGTVEKWNIKTGDIISKDRAKQRPALAVTEPCKHGVQIGGLCGLCGKDMTDYDYTGYSDASRASIQMTHLAHGPTVSLEEAQRIERETADHLLKSRKLSLIVDLDQTIVHATVDPTVGEWIAEGEAWEAKQAKKAEKASSTPKDEDDVYTDSDSDDEDEDEDEEPNPNWEALKDVKKFRLAPEAFGTPPGRAPYKGKAKVIENDGCLYYIKPRPGLHEFLRRVATKYEMHVYTMGTRAYAEEVCKAVDPDGTLFGGRLLSRDESGSLTQKSLQRLFPCDTSMVVIIDDRADVWEWCPNLIKVVPYDFFVGIGDINSTFLPKLSALSAMVPSPPPADTSDSPQQGTVTPEASKPPSPDSTVVAGSPTSSASSTVPSSSAEEEEELTKSALITQNSLALEAQLEDRPLARKQEELQNTEQEEVPRGESPPSERTTPEALAEEQPEDGSAKQIKPVRKALLRNDDYELQRVHQLLSEVHQRFYNNYDASQCNQSSGNRSRRGDFISYDVKDIIPRLRMRTLEGVHILFSSVIPLDTDPQSTEIWRMAYAFGAQCHTELSSQVTHVVAAKRGTAKVDAARRRGGVQIVWLKWFTDSIALWRRQDETPYLLDEPSVPEAASSSPIADSNQNSSDPEPDTDDWDPDEAIEEAPEPLVLDDVDWDAIRDEVDAAMEESDGDDDQSVKSAATNGEFSESDVSITDESVARYVVGSCAWLTQSTPRLKRKRLRSLTPSEIRGLSNTDADNLRSPLAKRKKIAMARSGSSKLREAIHAEELEEKRSVTNGSSRHASPAAAPLPVEAIREEDEGDGEEDDFDFDDDFLARDLEEELG
ncbi:hypothetical protein OE88DRAFT_1670218 [Heliocybe sulcata]|uniref:RNA polymerase II subunit A C-terminal domain phosphatase n=1 Tax=Heliocybe sulcata TaxID=5364 RepID=A0A5C3NG84_9AGAM|nr:hypothetical protein OE88DRAFT_1670218 [Heliocybe sulcata]